MPGAAYMWLDFEKQSPCSQGKFMKIMCKRGFGGQQSRVNCRSRQVVHRQKEFPEIITTGTPHALQEFVPEQL